ncbi:DUF5522 domain-containing protein [Larkinella harenae]
MATTHSKKLQIEGLDDEDYYFNEQGYLVFTEAYHLKRGYCCKNGCKHCPYKKIKS